MKKGGQFCSRGFTIVETLIVLAVTGVLFTAVAVTLSGKQAHTQFEQSIQEIQSQLQQTISDVATGYYPNANNFKCSAGSGGPQFTGASNEQGTNAGCVFLGKAVQFKVGSTDPEQFNIFSIAGLQRVTSGGDEVTTYAEAKPRAIAPSDTDSTMPDATDNKKLLYGLTTYRAFYGSTQIGAVAFVNSLATYSSGNVVSGSQQVKLVPINGSNLGETSTSMADKINNNLASSPVSPSTGVSICFTSGTTEQSGLITIGGNGRELSVTLSIKGNKTCDL